MNARRSKQERDAARRQWQSEKKRRERLEAFIAKLSDADREELGAELDELGAWTIPPATRFMKERLNAIPHDDPQFRSNWQRVLIDLVASDIPLDASYRRLIAAELHRLYFPNAERDRRERHQLEAAIIADLKRQLLSRGMTAADAESEIVSSIGKKLGLVKVVALRKRVQRVLQKNNRTRI
jgi:hypothetical protein